jgi:hypothetical protein
MTDIDTGESLDQKPFVEDVNGLEVYGIKGGKDYRAIVGSAGGIAEHDRLVSVEMAQTAGAIGFATKAGMDADLAHDDGTLALVTNDDVDAAANNGTYRKTGASGAGSWIKSADRVSVVETRVTTAEGDIETLDGRATAVEGRAAALEDRATATEGRATALEGRATVTEGDVDALQAAAVELDNRITDLAGGNVTAEGATEGAALALPQKPAGYRKTVIDGRAFAVPYFLWREPVDLDIAVGQSNDDGRGDYTLAPIAPNGMVIIDGVITEPPLIDPVGPTSEGDMWPAFSNAYYAATGRMTAFVPAAKGNTSLLAAADTGSGNWSPTGTLRAAAAAAANQAIAALKASNTYSLGRVRFVWCQGERDAESNNGTTISASLYEQALKDLAVYFKAQVPEMLEMVVIQTGRDGQVPSRNAQYALYRQAQANACEASSLLRMVCTAGMSMTYRIPQWMEAGDGLHYNQYALNQIGSMAAYETAIPDATVFAPSPKVTVDNYSGAAVGSRTIAYNCGASCKSLVVAVGIGKSANTTGSVTGVTFGGKAMRQAQKAGSAWATIPASAAQASIWILDEDDYAASLSDASGEIVVALNATASVIVSTSIIESDEPLVIESQDWLADTDGTVPAIATTNYANSATLLVTCIAGRVDSASPVSFGFSSGVEATDYGYNLDTRSFSVATAYEVLAAPVYGKVVTVTPSASMVHAGIVSACFRRRPAGETDVA